MPTVSVQQAFELALQHHREGRLQDAEAIYRQILAHDPNHADATHLLGVIAHQVGRDDVAVTLIRQAIALLPGAPGFHSNLGVAYRKLGRLDEAVAAYRRAIELDPNYAEAHANLGAALSEKGLLDEAVFTYRRALQLKPDYAEAHYNFGNTLRNKGQLDDAIASFRKAIQSKPDYAEAHNNLGNALRDRGQFDEAIAAFRRAIQIKPDYAEAHTNLGNAFRDSGQIDEAVASCRRALQLKPDFVEGYNNLGNALKDHGELDEAIAAYRRAIELKPLFAEAHGNLANALTNKGYLDEAIAACNRALQLKPDFVEAQSNLGNALKDLGRLEEAIAAYRRALELRPDYAEAHNNLGNALKDLGLLDEAVAAYRRALGFKPDSAETYNNLGNALKDRGDLDEAIAAYHRALELKPVFSLAHSNLLLGLHYLQEVDAQALFEEHCRWDQIQARPLAKFIEPHTNSSAPERRLRIGYLSPDFREHSVAFFVENVLACHDRNQVETFCYADVLRPDSYTARLQKDAGQWRSITSLSDSQAVDLIRRDQIDILVDLAGHTARNRLLIFARKPAPIQVTWLGYPTTTGMSAMDYRLTDAIADPPAVKQTLLSAESSAADWKPSLHAATDPFHSEKLIRLPDVFACFHPVEDSPPVSPLPALARGHVTFASFHMLAKLNPRLLDWWVRILLQVPDSRLLLAATGLNEVSRQRWLIDFFAGKGIEGRRLEFRGRQSLRQYLELHHEADVMLDCHPFTGHTISCHALWMGVPVVTLAGDRHCARMVASVLSNLGLPELIARTPDEYVKIASELAGDLPRLAELRATLRERMQASPLTDGPRFTRNLEQAFREMWRAWCANPS